VTVYELSANVELLFTEHGGNVATRVRAAAELGLPAVEIWTWRDKDITQLEKALTETGVMLQTMCVEPIGALVDPSMHEAFLAALACSASVADRLSCPILVITAGDDRDGVPRAKQHQATVDALSQAVRILELYDVTLLLENLNSRVDHVGTFLDSTVECLDILEEVGSARVQLLYDHYHSLMMEERPEVVLAGRTSLLAHVQIADVPGRHEPGSATVDWHHELTILRQLGYTGRIGLEYLPTAETSRSLEHIQSVAAE
jgi:hydroxypyruvate isomerase